jgi:hypothetical protein
MNSTLEFCVLREGIRPGLIYVVSLLEFLVYPSTWNNWSQLEFQLRKIKKNSREVMGEKQTSGSLVIIHVWWLQRFCEYEHLVICCFFALIDFLGLAAPEWFFSLSSKSFHFVTKYLCQLLYIFGELFGFSCFGVYLLFLVLIHIFHHIKS